MSETTKKFNEIVGFNYDNMSEIMRYMVDEVTEARNSEEAQEDKNLVNAYDVFVLKLKETQEALEEIHKIIYS